MTNPTPAPEEVLTTPPAPPLASKPLFSRLFIGVVAVAVFIIAILAIALVQVLPQAFGSLANLYNTLHGARSDRTLEVTESTETLRSGESVTLSWSTTTPAGIYTFLYDCQDTPVTVELRKNDGLRNVRCDTTYSLGETNNLEITARTEATEPVTFSYTVGFLRTNDTDPRASHSGELTITDGAAGTPSAPAPDTTLKTDDSEITVETPLARIETPQLPSLGAQQVLTTYPTSNPRGHIDLAVRFVAIGIQNSNQFLPLTSLLNKRQNALRFEVFNYGTKTSGKWNYAVRLPDGSTYRSGEQAPLKPNERTTITLGFPVDEESSKVTTSVTIDASGDRTSINDKFIKTLLVNR